MTKSKPLERIAEDKFVQWCKDQGWECLKLCILGENGFPDRTVITPHCVIFVEFKREGEKLRPRQVVWMERLSFELGQWYLTATDFERVREQTLAIVKACKQESQE